MGKQMQAFLVICSALLPLLVLPAGFKCNLDTLDASAGTFCCRDSRDFGISSCDGYTNPRRMILELDLTVINGKYGLLAADEDIQHNGNRSLQHSFIFGAVLSLLLYNTMLSSKRSPITKQITLASILGILVFGPSFYFDALNVENAAVRFPVCLNSFLYILRTLEAYFGFTPEGAKRSALMYCIYFVLPVDIVYDAKCQKPVKATRNDVLHKLWFLVSTFVFNVLLLAILCHTDYLPFGPTNAGRYDRSTLLRDYFDPRHLGNCFFLGLWFQQLLAWSVGVVEFAVEALVGWKCKPMIASPLLKSTRPSDFWSKRWNIVVHSLLKRGVYKPAHRYYSAFASSVIVFAVSGLMHEWLVYSGMKYHRTRIPEAAYYKPSNITLGSNFAFFLYGAIPVMMEKLLGNISLANSLGKALPQPVKTCCVLLTTLPMAFWFADPYFHGRLFLDYEDLGFMAIKMQ